METATLKYMDRIGYEPKRWQHDVSFDVKRGSILAIMARSGSGKSMLLKALIGPLRPSARVDLLPPDVNDCCWTTTKKRKDRRHFGALFEGGVLQAPDGAEMLRRCSFSVHRPRSRQSTDRCN